MATARMNGSATIEDAIRPAAAEEAARSAATAHLVYVSDKQPGISRQRKGKGFAYYFGDKRITDKKELDRIRSLVIPPAWTQVWICAQANGHLQATGVDARQRKQYLYHPRWMALRGENKFSRLQELGKALPAIREKVNKDLAQQGLVRTKVLAAIVSIMEQTTIRIGSEFYEKLYGSFGLSTLKGRHVKVNGNSIRFLFKGKKGVVHDISISSRRLAKIIQHCKHIPGKDLLKYIDEDHIVHDITSGDINDYIREISESDFTSKDFRTWAGSVECIRALTDSGEATLKKEVKQNIVEALDQVARHLGNTRSVCKKHYVHPAVIEWYENGKLNGLADKKKTNSMANMDESEMILMTLLSCK